MWDCTKDKAEPPEGTNNGDEEEMKVDSSTCDSIYNGFSADIAPIFSGNCATSGCHDNGTGANGIVLESHAQIEDEVKNGNVLCAIEHETGCNPMPNGQPQLDQDTIEAIKCWKDAGFPND